MTPNAWLLAQESTPQTLDAANLPMILLLLAVLTVTLVASLINLYCFITALFKIWSGGHPGLAWLFLLTTPIGIGKLATFIYGWVKSRSLHLGETMRTWTFSMLVSAATSGFLYLLKDELRAIDASASLWWGLILASLGLALILPRAVNVTRVIGCCLGVLGAGMLASSLDPVAQDLINNFVFYLLASLTVISAAATVSVRNPVYSAIWFALTLLGSAGLFLFQGAQFLGVATVVVYAGAILVTFLFVLMLAQPEGQAQYDRISWGWAPKPLAAIAGALLLGVLLYAIGESELTPIRSAEDLKAHQQVMAPNHMAHLGGQLFGRHLVAVEIAGTLLLAALVGAVSIVIQGKASPQEARSRG